MSALLLVSRAILAFVGALALLFATANLVTGGVPLTDPVLPAGLAFGALTVGSAIWTTAAERWKAVIVWLGIVAIGVTIVVFIANVGEAAFADVAIYFGIPAAIVSVSALVIALARFRAGPVGRS